MAQSSAAAHAPRFRAQVALVYGTGLLQGLALVTFPAASAVFTSPQGYDLSAGEYGAMFVPQTILAVTSALLGARFQRRWGNARVLDLGLGANLVSMALLVASRAFIGVHALAYGVLLASTTFMGLGFGLTIPVVNDQAARLFPRRVDVAVLALNALLGLGTALAPVLVALFNGLGIWWGLPVAVGLLFVVFLAWAILLSSSSGGATPATAKLRGPGLRALVSFALLYGLVETLNGNWAILYVRNVLKASAGLASIALSLFWAAVTGGRVLFGSIERSVPGATTFRLLPWLIGAAFVATALAPSTVPGVGVASFALAGLGCSALLPLTISLGRDAASPGVLIASYQIGYGLAAFGIAPLHGRLGLGLRTIFGLATGIALALGALSVVIVRILHRAPTASGAAADRP